MLPPCPHPCSPPGAHRPQHTHTAVPPGSPPLHAQTPGYPQGTPHAHSPGMSPPSHRAPGQRPPHGVQPPRGTTAVTPPDEEEEEAGEAGVPSKVHSMEVGAEGSPAGGCSPSSAPCPAAKRPRDILKPCSRLLPGALPALPAPGLERGRGWGDATPPIAACAPAGRPRTAPGAQGEPDTAGLLAGTRRRPPAVTRGHSSVTPSAPSPPPSAV